MSPATREQYRQRVQEVAARAATILPQAVNGRIAKAVKFVLAGDVQPQADGSIVVFSSSDPTRRYVLIGTGCTCADYERGQAPEGWCAHRISAGIHKRVGQEMAAQAPEVKPEVVLPEPMEAYPDNDHEAVEMPPTPAPAPAPLPEAPASVNVRVQIAGREVQWTLRDTDEARLAGRLEALLARYPVSTPLPSAEPEPEKRYCPTHGTALRWNAGKDGRKGWWSHKTAEGTWCQGKGGPR